MLMGHKRRVSKSYSGAFMNNGRKGVEGFIEANSQPQVRKKRSSERVREFRNHQEQVKFSSKLDLSGIRSNLKSITQFK